MGAVYLRVSFTRHPLSRNLLDLRLLLVPREEKAIFANNLLGTIPKDLARPFVNIINLPRGIERKGTHVKVIQEVLILTIEGIQLLLRTPKREHKKDSRKNHNHDRCKGDGPRLQQPPMDIRLNASERLNSHHVPDIPRSDRQGRITYQNMLALFPSLFIDIKIRTHDLPSTIRQTRRLDKGGNLLLEKRGKLGVGEKDLSSLVCYDPVDSLRRAQRCHGKEVRSYRPGTQNCKENSKIRLAPENGCRHQENFRFYQPLLKGIEPGHIERANHRRPTKSGNLEQHLVLF